MHEEDSIYCLQSPKNETFLTVIHPENHDSPVKFFAGNNYVSWDKNTHFKIIKSGNHFLIKNGNHFVVNENLGLKLSKFEGSLFKPIVDHKSGITTFVNIKTNQAFDVIVVDLKDVLILHQNLNLLKSNPMDDMVDLDTSKKYLIKFKNIDAVITAGNNAGKETPIRLFGTVEESKKCFNYSYFELEKKIMSPPGFSPPIYFYYIKKAGTNLYMQWKTPTGSDHPLTPDKTTTYQMFLGEKQDIPGAQGNHPDFIIVKSGDSYRIKNFYQSMKHELNTQAYLSIDKEKKEQNAAVAKVDSLDEFDFVPIEENLKVENFGNINSSNFKILIPLILIIIIILITCFFMR